MISLRQESQIPLLSATSSTRSPSQLGSKLLRVQCRRLAVHKEAIILERPAINTLNPATQLNQAPADFCSRLLPSLHLSVQCWHLAWFITAMLQPDSKMSHVCTVRELKFMIYRCRAVSEKRVFTQSSQTHLQCASTEAHRLCAVLLRPRNRASSRGHCDRRDESYSSA